MYIKSTDLTILGSVLYQSILATQTGNEEVYVHSTCFVGRHYTDTRLRTLLELCYFWLLGQVLLLMDASCYLMGACFLLDLVLIRNGVYEPIKKTPSKHSQLIPVSVTCILSCPNFELLFLYLTHLFDQIFSRTCA